MLLAIPLICATLSSAQAGVLAYESFGDGTDGTTLAGYDSTTPGMDSGLSGTWAINTTAAFLSTPPSMGNQVGIFGGVTPDSNGGAQHCVKQNA